jgi:hypothetical protein
VRELLRRIGVIGRLNALWNPEIEAALKPLRHEVRRLTNRLAELEQALEETTSQARRADRIAAQVQLTTLLDERQAARVSELPRLLDDQRVTRHIRDAIGAATILTDPYEHCVVERLLPDDVYALLIETIPPVVFFGDRDPIKQDLRFPLEFGPKLHATTWGFFDEVIARKAIREAVLEKFSEALQRHFDSIFGPEFRERANQLPSDVSGGRLMLRRPGYHLSPHRDPKRAMLTCLLYLARPGDSEEHGTQIFRVQGDSDATYKETYYPEQDGRPCELVKVVPFRPNTMLVFLNSRGAHGATIPSDAPANLERYAYQFYVAPENVALGRLIRSLPADRRILWQDKADRQEAL